MPTRAYDIDAVVIGSGPNGLSAAIAIAQKGHSVVVYEAQNTIGGGARSAELTLPGFIHDVCSSVHPLAAASPFFQTLELERFGLRWVMPEIALAHPFDNGEAAAIQAPFGSNLSQFGTDAHAIRQLVGPLVQFWADISKDVPGPPRLPAHPLALARFGFKALQSARKVSRRFRTEKARAVFAGMAAHSVLPLDYWASASFGLLLWASCYSVGWPFAAGGSQTIADALTKVLRSHGGEIVTNHPIRSLDDLPSARAILCDVTPQQFLQIAADRVTSSERHKLSRFQYGPGVFKIDWALDAPIPWKAAVCRKAGSLHIGGSFEEIARSEAAVWSGQVSEQPFLILAQPSLFDPSRAPKGKHTAWAYCHVPHGSNFDMRQRIEAQVERFAPGFGQCVLARSVMGPLDLEKHNPNLIGGDIAGGAMNLGQLFARPTWRLYRTSAPRTFLCSASTPPGPGVHGMSGYRAALLALKQCFQSEAR